MSALNSLYDINVDDDNNIIDNSPVANTTNNGYTFAISANSNNTFNSLATNTVLTTGTSTANAVWIPSNSGTTTHTSPSDTRAINIDKISEMDEVKRGLVMQIIGEYVKASWGGQKEILENTLDAYGIFENKDSLKRKQKIEDVLK
jgi:hypothetical protein